MHVVTHLSEKYEKMRTPANGWSIYEAGMAQLDDIVGSVMQRLKDLGIEDNTILVFTTDNGSESFTGRMGAKTRLLARKALCWSAAFARRALSAGRARSRESVHRINVSRSFPRSSLETI
jgi:arylsulfatase A-like enzyme